MVFCLDFTHLLAVLRPCVGSTRVAILRDDRFVLPLPSALSRPTRFWARVRTLRRSCPSSCLIDLAVTFYFRVFVDC